MSYRLVCRACHKELFEDCYRCPECGGVLDCRFDLKDKTYYSSVIKNAQTFWDYKPLLPLKGENYITIGEGSTALVDAERLATKLSVRKVLVKNEGQNPTGTFKDRCLSVGYSKAKEMKAPATVIGSAGNAGAAAAAYAAKSELPCFVMVPATTSMERVVQTLMYGANMIKINGNVSDCIEMLTKVCRARGWHNMTTAHPCNPFQAEGTKTIAYELARELDWRMPDWVIVPIGGGGILTGIYKGFCDMKALGLIDKMPRMAGVQEDGCSAVVNAFQIHAKPEEVKRVECPSGVAVAINDAYPLDGGTALAAIYDSSGYAEKVNAQEIADAQSLLGSTAGVFAEPASACSIAGLVKLLNKGVIGSEHTVVCIVTGSGLKDTSFAISHANSPQVVNMDDAELSGAIERCLSISK